MAVLQQYLWIAVMGGICGFFYAFGIGANDVANAFASTVASKSLTLKQAVIVAGIFEFLGALLLGASVTTTIRSGIFDTSLYNGESEIVLLGMFTSLLTGTIMLLGATAMALPVSTTHTIVGSIMGFTIVAKGFESVNVDVVVKIIISWLVSPIVSGILAFIFFGLVRRFVMMNNEDPFKRAYYTFPVVLTIGIGIDLFYVLYKGFKNTSFADQMSLKVVLPVSFAAGFVCGLVWIFLVGPFAKKRVEAHLQKNGQGISQTEKTQREASSAHDSKVIDLDAIYEKNHSKEGKDEEAQLEGEGEGSSTLNSQTDVNAPSVDEPQSGAEVGGDQEEEKKQGFFKRASVKFAKSTYDQDLHLQSMHESSRAMEIWDAAEQYDVNAEQLFTYLQVFTACLNSFAHGANDVSNAIAPLSAIIIIYQTGELESKSPVQKWVLAYGGIAIVLGLLLYGYKVMKSVGFKLCALSPSRGASAELAASLFVVTASFIGIPVSSTQCIVGAVSGVGLVGGIHNVQWLFLARVAIGWVGVFVVAALLSAGIFAMFAFSPSLV